MNRIGALARGPVALLSPCIAARPMGHATVEVKRWLPHGARLGIDIGGVWMRVGDVRNPERCGFRPSAEDWVAMIIRIIVNTNMHIISKVSGSGTAV